MPTPFRHATNQTSWYGHVGRGKSRRLKNLEVPLFEPIEKAQETLDRLNDEWDREQEKPPSKYAVPRRPLKALFEKYKAVKDGHYRDSRHGFDDPAARVAKIIKACKFRYVPDITSLAVMNHIESLRGPRFGAATAEHYRRDFVGFCNWLHEEGHLARKLFGRRDRFRGEQHHKRRALTLDEQHRLLDAAAKGRTHSRVTPLTGRVRRLIYWTALTTGYRSGEMRAITVSGVRPDRILLDKQYTKNGDDADQPIPSDLARELAEYVAGRDPNEKLFPSWKYGSRMIRIDLRAAGIPYVTAEGVADVHSLRCTYCTQIFIAGADAKTAHILMRHKTIEMTMRYAKTDDRRKREVVERLPKLGEAYKAIDGLRIEPSHPSDLARLFGSDDIDRLELLGSVKVEDNGLVVLAFGPYAGTPVGEVEMCKRGYEGDEKMRVVSD